MFLMIDILMITSLTAQEKTNVTQEQNYKIYQSNFLHSTLKMTQLINDIAYQAYQDKCHFLSSLDISAKFSLLTCILENSDSSKPVGVTVDRKLNFKKHITNLCDKVSRIIQPFARIFPYIPQTQNRLLMNACLCPLVWMNYSFKPHTK